MFKGPTGGNKGIGTIFHQALNWTADRLISAFSNARRVHKLKSEVAALNAHIELINVCYADRLVALEHEHRQKIGAQADELRGLVARVLPPNLDPQAQIVISGEAAHELWGKFASLSNHDPAGSKRDVAHWVLAADARRSDGLNCIS